MADNAELISNLPPPCGAHEASVLSTTSSSFTLPPGKGILTVDRPSNDAYVWFSDTDTTVLAASIPDIRTEVASTAAPEFRCGNGHKPYVHVIGKTATAEVRLLWETE